MLVHDEPFAFHFAIDVGGAHRHLEFAAFGIGADEMLDAVAVGKLALGGDSEIAERGGGKGDWVRENLSAGWDDDAVLAGEEKLPVGGGIDGG